jgi:hypothetical protein
MFINKQQMCLFLSVYYFILPLLHDNGYGVSAWALTPYPGDLNHCRSCTPASEVGLKGSPKHVRQK